MKRILVCLDSSKRAPQVLAAGIDLAKKTGAKIALFRAVGLPAELNESVIGISPNTILEHLIAHADAAIKEAAKDVPAAMLDGAYTKVGTPWDAICREATKRDCDVIVIGSHGYGAIDRILGTTAAKVVNHADRSVLVVR